MNERQARQAAHQIVWQLIQRDLDTGNQWERVDGEYLYDQTTIDKINKELDAIAQYHFNLSRREK